MLKRITLTAVFFAITACTSSFAQMSSSASQTVHIQVAPAIEIGNNGNGNGNGNGNNNNGKGGNNVFTTQGNNGNHGNGNNGNGNGNNGNKMAGNGDNDSNQDFTVNATKEFIISVKALDNIAADNILIALANNNTGGKANPAFSSTFGAVNSRSQELLMNCGFGDRKNFTVNYKTKNTREQRLTKADIIYTATLP